MADFLLDSLRGGLNDIDPPNSLRKDQVTICENIDFSRSTLGAKRRGSVPVTISGSGGICTYLYRHFPTTNQYSTELWKISFPSDDTAMAQWKDTAWHTATFLDDIGTTHQDGPYGFQAASLGGKLFLAYPSESGSSQPCDRLHVRDVGSSTIRRTGLAEPPAAPNVADSAPAGSYTVTRYFRVRYTVVSGTTVLRRSEPTDATTFVPNGSKSGAVITKPATINESETNWEIEESINNADFYRIASVVVGTTTYTDTLASTAVATTGILSADVGDYTNIWSAKFLSVDQDRLLFGGSWEQSALSCRVGWTPVGGSVGAGNNERTEEDTDPFLDLDNIDGGELTGLIGPLNTYTYAFKNQRIYRLVRTGKRAQSYDSAPLSTSMGALKGSPVMAMDAQGKSVLFFLDPATGPAVVGAAGIESCGSDVLGTWENLGVSAVTVACHGVWHSDLKQVWWWITTEGHSFPNLRLVLHVEYMQRNDLGQLSGGWSLHGDFANVFASCMFSDNINDNTSRLRRLKPITSEGVNALFICDSGSLDQATTPYRARVRTRPFALANTIRQAGVMDAVLTAVVESGSTVYVSFIRDYGMETRSFAVDLSATSTESRVIKPMDEACISEAKVIEIEIGDLTASGTTFSLDSIVMDTRVEGRS